MDRLHTAQVVRSLAASRDDRFLDAFWDTVCGLVARAWRLGVFDEVAAMYRMDGHDHCDISGPATALLIEADRLIPADSVNGPLCLAVLDALI